MKFNAKKLLVIFCLNLAFSNLMFFNISEAQLDYEKTHTPSLDRIAVLSMPAYAQGIAISSKPNTTNFSTEACSPAISQSGTLVQVQNTFNLNQSAECFRLTGVVKATTLTKLAVEPLKLGRMSVVVMPDVQLVKEHYQFPVSTEPTAVPLIPIMVFVSVIFSAGKNFLIKNKTRLTLSLKKSLSLHQLQVMRC